MIEKIINSGNTGSEAGALSAAWLAEIKTGGHIPKGYKTSTGYNPHLAMFGLTEADAEAKQSTCLKLNIDNSDGTLLFIKNVKEVGRAEDFTREYCHRTMKPCLVIPLENLHDYNSIDIFLRDRKIKTLHVTGKIDPKEKTPAHNIVFRYMKKYFKGINSKVI